MTKTVEMLFERNKIFLPVAAEIDLMYEDQNGFIISILTVDPTWQSFTGFPHYVVFTYDEKKEPKVAYMANQYGDIVVWWRDNVGEVDEWELGFSTP